MTDTPKTLLEAVRYFARRPTIKPETSEMAKINFDVPHLCPNCAEPMQVLMPIWITPGSESVDTGNIDYESNNPQDSGNWFCENCESHHFPIGLDEDNAGCDDCGIHDRVPGSKLCAGCGSLDSAVRSPLFERTDAKITELIRDVNDGDCALSAIFDDGSTRKLFNFYIDELAFFDADLIGKTQDEAHQLHHARTLAYLQLD